MEKVYWISETDELDKMNDEIRLYGGHVTMVSSSSTTKDQDYPVHAFIVVSYTRDIPPGN